MIVELGAGKTPSVDGATTVDKRGFDGIDHVHDVETGLPFDASEAETVVAIHLLEHIDDLPSLMDDIHRVLVSGGELVGRVPHYRDQQAYDDPTHERLFTTRSFDYWDSRTELGSLSYFDAEYQVERCQRVRRWRVWKARPIDFRLIAQPGGAA